MSATALGREGDELLQILRRANPRERKRIIEGMRAEVRRERTRLYRGASLASFAHDCIRWPEGQGPAPYQSEIWEELPVRKKVSVRGPHGTGKSCTSSIAILGFALAWDGDIEADWKIVTTASVFYQLKQYLWPEVHKWSRLLDWERIGRPPFTKNELLLMQLNLATGSAFGASPADAAAIEGAHARRLLYVFDEAKIIPVEVWDAAEGAFSSEDSDCLALSISTPGPPGGRFYDIQSRKAGYEDWWTRHVTLEEAIKAGRISRDWAEQRAKQWGRKSAVYQNRVEGQFAASEEDSVIPLAWVEAANDRWRERFGSFDAWEPPGPLTALGVDVARGGGDLTVLARRYDNAIGPLEPHDYNTTMITAGLVTGVLHAHEEAQALIDVNGLGAGVVDRCREDDEVALRITAFNSSRASLRTDKSGELGFVNQKSAAWWYLRELLDPEDDHNIALPPDDTLTGDLVAPKWTIKSNTKGGRIFMEPKDHVKKRLGRSPDSGDAVVMSFWPEWDDGEFDMSGIDTFMDSGPLQ